MNQIKKISKNVGRNHLRWHMWKLSLFRVTAVMVLAMSVLSHSLLAEAEAAEPDITRDMRNLAIDGVYLTGLKHRLKAEDSLMQKILTDAVQENIALEQAAEGISDVLRYTLVIAPAEYSRRVPEIMHKLTESGYKVIKFNNAWGGRFYQGINVQLLSPAGMKTELQLHTPNSYAIKQASHGVYEIRRNPESTPEEVAEATAKSLAYNAQVKMPVGAENITWPL
ncbi:hypothetical protein SELR_21470 [Selenomonas ruminantium subsp. lactilytica TAM6421]|uniref:Uncharacterized protein n=1 Tax=Selenomonas ruminantium subsp. lactilytica (strain NBRC 103574 / TAM6421) TaxID=927704 RepID=I0GSW8_SELRL|nr:hypothetical protein [Selenomonas ruminantium]BAL83855.1 hypothetical protein SELR_21470 [Selenomonas ruminantium subsp. lactilytica TAM6421]